MSQKRTIHIRDINDLEIIPDWQDGSFDMIIDCESKKAIIHFDFRCWIEQIAKGLWKVIESEENQIKDAKNAMTNDDC